MNDSPTLTNGPWRLANFVTANLMELIMSSVKGKQTMRTSPQ